MNIIEKIIAILAAPFTGVYKWLDERISNKIIVKIVYALWVGLFGTLLLGGGLLAYAAIYVKKHPEDSDTEE